jgi:hypothetical protein
VASKTRITAYLPDREVFPARRRPPHSLRFPSSAPVDWCLPWQRGAGAARVGRRGPQHHSRPGRFLESPRGESRRGSLQLRAVGRLAGGGRHRARRVHRQAARGRAGCIPACLPVGRGAAGASLPPGRRPAARHGGSRRKHYLGRYGRRRSVHPESRPASTPWCNLCRKTPLWRSPSGAARRA